MRALSAAGLASALLLAAIGLLTACGGDTEPTAQPPAQTQATTSEPPPAESPATTAATPPTTAEPPAPAESPATTEAEPPAPEPTPLPGPGLPQEILGYQDWLQLNEEPIPPIAGGDAHLGTKDVYASEKGDRSNGSIVYPDGTIIVKEAARPDTDFIGLVAVMRKEAGADPDHGDWIFIEYTRDSADGEFGVQARDAVCWSCHAGAQDTDWVWVHTTGAAR